ncbi:MAG: hypothetical protein ABI426_12230 [Flavobacterium sp.]
MSKKTKQKQNKNSNSFKIVIILLACTMLGGFFFMYKMSSRSKKAIILLREQKLNLIGDLEKSELFLNQVLTSNKSLSKKLATEHIKIKKLIQDLKKKNINEKSIVVYQKSSDAVDDRVKLLLTEINTYKKRIDSTNTVLKNTNIVLKKEKTKNDTLTVSNNKLVKKITGATKLYFYDLKTASFKVRGSGKQIETDKASKADLLKVSFMIAENDLVKSTTKDFFIQIIDFKNNVLGSKKIETFGKETLTYSTAAKVKYANKTIKVEEEIPVTDLEKGLFYVNIFDKTKLVLKTTFTLN